MRKAGGCIVSALALVLIAVAAPPRAAAQDGATLFKPEELEQIVAPIALYPDPLLVQVMMATTYPLEIVQAARFAKANPSLQGDPLNEALKQQTWDDSVKSLVAFPQVLTMLNDKLDWTQKLGDAVLAQQADVMAAVQRLRVKAQAEGNLQTTAQQTVAAAPAQAAAGAPQQTIITIEPANPEVVYVPTYNPATIYGAWPYAAYPPYPVYAPGAALAAGAITFGAGMAVGAALWGSADWGHGDVNINSSRYNSFSSNVNTSERRNQIQANRANVQGGNSWQHNPEHRRGTQYRDTATQQRFNRTGAPNPESREAFRGRAEQGRQQLAAGGGAQGARASQAAGQARAGQGAGEARAGQAAGQARSGQAAGQARGGEGIGQARAGQGAPQARASQPAAQARAGGAGGGAFEGVGQGRAAQAQSSRGQASVGAARASGGGGHVAASPGGGGGRGGGAGGGGGRGGGGGGGRGGGGRGR